MAKGDKNIETSEKKAEVSPVQSLESEKSLQTPQKSNFLYFIETDNGIREAHLELVKNKIQSFSGEKLFLILHTIGGDVYSAVKIMKILQDKCKLIKVIVPDFAYSSGTMMALGSDEIYMGTDSTISPLDLPMEHPNDGCTISSLDVTNTLSNLASICTSMGVKIYEELRRKDNADLRLGKSLAAKLAFDTANSLITPIIDKIDPFNLQRGFREAKIGLYYAIDLLGARMMKDNLRQAVDTGRALVNNYPSHSYGIFRDEARDILKLKISNLETLEEWKLVSAKFEKLKKDYSKYINFEVL